MKQPRRVMFVTVGTTALSAVDLGGKGPKADGLRKECDQHRYGFLGRAFDECLLEHTKLPFLLTPRADKKCPAAINLLDRLRRVLARGVGPRSRGQHRGRTFAAIRVIVPEQNDGTGDENR